jgi:uncharacterized protein (DUF2267 family)
MNQGTLSAFEQTVQITHVWLNEIRQRLGWEDPQRAYRALRAVLHALRDRLTVHDASHLSAQLPMLVRGFYYEGYHPAGVPSPERSRIAFLKHVKSDFPDDGFDVENIVRAVFGVLSKHITPNEVEKIKACLPADIRALWSEPVATH